MKTHIIKPPTPEEIATITAHPSIPGDKPSNYITTLPDGRIWDASHCMFWDVKLPNGKTQWVQAKDAETAIRGAVEAHKYGWDFEPEIIEIPFIII